MNTQVISKEQIVNYYDSAEIDYKLIWNLRESRALHFGYWDDQVKNFREALGRENEVLAEIAHIKSSDIVLDAGCGVGGSSIFLAKKFGCKVIGITLSQKQADMATKNAQESGVASNTKFLVVDFENMTFPDGKFDVVWGIESICHANSKKKFIEDSYRILKPSGRLIVADGFTTRSHFTDEEKNTMQKWLSGWGVNFLETKENFEAFSAKIGFQKISFTDVTKNVMPSSKRLYKYSFPAMFFGKIAEFLRLRTKIQTGNIIAARYQHTALLSGLWKYGIFYAEK